MVEKEIKTFSRFGVWYPIVVFGISIFATAFISVILALVGVDLLNDQKVLLLVNALLFVFLGVGAWLGWRIKGTPMEEIFSLKRVTKKQIILTMLGYALLQPVLVLISSAINEIFKLNITGNSDSIVNGQLSIITLLAVMIVAPLFEEIFFRGILFDGFLNSFRKFIPVKDSVRVAFTVAFTGFFFGLLHLTAFDVNGYVSVATTALLGVSFAMLRAKTGSLTLNILGHFAFNSVGFLFIALSYFMAS